MPRDPSSCSNCSLLTKSRRTGSWRSCFQSILTAPLLWPLSYAVVSSSTSTRTTDGSSRCCSTQSASTSAAERLMVGLLWRWVVGGSGRVSGGPEVSSVEAGRQQGHLIAEAPAEDSVQHGALRQCQV